MLLQLLILRRNLIDGHSPQIYCYGLFRGLLTYDNATEHSSVTNHQNNRPTLPPAAHFTHTYPSSTSRRKLCLDLMDVKDLNIFNFEVAQEEDLLLISQDIVHDLLIFRNVARKKEEAKIPMTSRLSTTMAMNWSPQKKITRI